MLTMRPPIRVRFQTPIDTVHRDMEERIRGNYSLLTDRIRKEELLHVTASSPEFYFEQGGVTNILNEITDQSRQELRLEVINNLVNRILVSNTENFTYQDSVYIGNVLRKIGITDVTQFMKQISNLQSERRENKQLIRLYEENKAYLTQITKNEQEKKRDIEKKDPVQSMQTEEYYLHETIYNRLNTGKIYQDIRAFVQGNVSNESKITSLEMTIAEQTSLAQTFQLHSLRNESLNTVMPLSYYHMNIYEGIGEEEEMNESVSSGVTSAVLTNLLDQVFCLKQESIERNHHRWYSVANAFFDTVENTWKRYQWNHTEGISVAEAVLNNTTFLSEKKQEEISVLTEMAEQYITWNRYRDQKNSEYQSEYLNQNLFYTEEAENPEQSEVVYHENAQTELQYLVSQINSENQETVRELTVEEIKEQLRITNERNLENLRKIQEIREQQRLQPRLLDVRVDKKSARENGLRALEQQEEVLRELQSPEVTKQQTNAIENNLYRQENYETDVVENTIQIPPAERYLRSEEEGVLQEESSKTAEVKAESETVYLSDRFIEENKQIISEVHNLEQIIRQQNAEYILERSVEPVKLFQAEVATEEIKTEVQKISRRVTDETVHVIKEREKEIMQSENTWVTERKERFFLQPNIVSGTDYFRSVSLQHKEEEQVINEEFLNTIRFQTQQTVREQTTENRMLREDKVVETNISQVTKQVTQQQIANMEELVQQNVKKQLGRLSDQVYGKLEKKLQTERKRRGY